MKLFEKAKHTIETTITKQETETVKLLDSLNSASSKT